jgi:hypothetical protein
MSEIEWETHTATVEDLEGVSTLTYLVNPSENTAVVLASDDVEHERAKVLRQRMLLPMFSQVVIKRT